MDNGKRSYNVGMNGIERRSNEQSSNNYYDLHLPNETSRYIFRLLALLRKYLKTNPNMVLLSENRTCMNILLQRK